jgi:transposase-like protein
MKKKCCPHCKSLNTQKRGAYQTEALTIQGKRKRKIQRYYCHACRKSFSQGTGSKRTRRYEPSLIHKAADLYFNAESSYRAVGRQLHVRPYQIFLWLNELGNNCKSFEEVACELSPQYSGYLVADGTTIFVKGDKNQLLLTADAESQDLPYAQLAHAEDYGSWRSTLLGLRDKIHYPARGAVIDGDPGLMRALKEVFPGIPIQLCVRHLHSYHVYHLKYQFQGHEEGIEPFLDITHRLLYTNDSGHLHYLLEEYNAMRNFLIESRLEAELLNFESKFGFIWTHFRYPGLPRTTNIIEGIIDQLKHKITDCHGFEYADTAWHCLKMVIMNYRFHKFTCSRINGHNGKSPLALAGVNTQGINWIKFSQKNAH